MSDMLPLLAVGVVAAVCVFAFVMLQGYLQPIHQAWANREIGREREPEFKPNYRICCPPALGCNESRPGYRATAPCRRMLALDLADVAETRELDDAWAAANRHLTPDSLEAWETARDCLLAAKVRDKTLLGLAEVKHAPEIARGEVVD